LAKQYLPVKIEDLGLNAKEIRFVGEYCSNGFNAPEAAKLVGLINGELSPAQERIRCHEILTLEKISRAVDRMVESTLNPYRDRIKSQMLVQLQIRANWDATWFFYPDGTAKPLDSISAEHRMAIDAVEEKYYGKDAVRTVTYTLSDKDKARKELAQLLGKKEEVSQEDTGGMRSKLNDIFLAVEKGIDMGISAQKKREMIETTKPIHSKDLIAKLKETGEYVVEE
jgi:hypothetical protein